VNSAVSASHRHFARSRLLRGVAASLAVTLSGVPLLEAAHSARVRHAMCSQDGEPIDVVPQPPELAHSDEMGAVLPGVRDAAGEHEHDHCCIAPRSRVSGHAGPVARSHAIDVASSGLHVKAQQDFTRPVQFAVYLFAPKLSPPRA
jgi:hypothetical protein